MNLTAYNTPDIFEQLRPEWNALLERSATNTIFSTWEWQSTWWQAYQEGELWLVVCRDEAGTLAGIAAWFIQPQPSGERVVRSIGCVDVTDYVDLLIDSAYADVVYPQLAAHLYERREAYDRINLCNIPEASPTRERLGGALEKLGFTVEIEEQEVCPVITLGASFDDYLESLDKKQRHELRRKLRRAEEGGMTWYTVGTEHDLAAEGERFIALMAASQKQKADFLAHVRHLDFFKSMVRQAAACGWLALSFAQVDGEDAAAYLNFDYGGRILVYNSGLMPDRFGHLSPGIVLLTQLIAHAIETKHTVFDFLRGNETYKYRMGAHDTRVYKLKARLGGLPDTEE